ncbi:MAG: uncharacterized protein H6Q77_2023 [Gemmatimonadetes bacterium]|nr:uncharacterized protein [Gemmatimonadota bacterium]
MVVLVVTAMITLYVIIAYNSLTRLRLLANGAWADIDVQLKRRHDLVPRLVETVKGHTGYERGTIEAVVAARNRATAAAGPAASGAAEGELSGAVRQIFALAEAYPDLKAGESFLSLQRSLTEIEDHIQNARRYYNAVVRDLNTKVAQFPTNVIAGPFGFRPREFFGLADASEASAPGIEFGRQP